MIAHTSLVVSRDIAACHCCCVLWTRARSVPGARGSLQLEHLCCKCGKCIRGKYIYIYIYTHPHTHD